MDYTEEQKQEFEALSAILMDDFVDLATTPMSCMITLSGIVTESNTTFHLKITLPDNYPDAIPYVDIPIRGHSHHNSLKVNLIQHLNDKAQENLGSPSLYTLVEEAKSWLAEHLHDYNTQQKNIIEVEQKQSIDETVKLEDGGQTESEGKWDFVIGLVGKPSAGKSTFFNAATKFPKAKVGIHPFTTIEPNFSQAFYSIPDPTNNRGIVSEPAYGKHHDGLRYIPVILKDVAGLVPGASDGKGRGNRFLNDLCDADVLIHVLDASGCTDECGEQTDAHNPSDDVTWLLGEVREWIYQNVQRKWEMIVKRPKRLMGMFTGYHCSPQLVQAAFARANLSTRNIEETLPTWSDDVLRRLVDSFVDVRFPMLLVLNKSDASSSHANIDRLACDFPTMPQIAVSAKVECLIQSYVSDSLIQHNWAAGKLESTGLPSDKFSSLEEQYKGIFERYGGTNVRQALNKAVSLRNPSYVFPVRDLTTLMSHDPVHKGQSSGVMKDCLVVKPGTTVKHLHTLMVHHYHLLSGNFVRAEALTPDGNSRILRKDDIIENNCVIKIMTTKKS
uniref:Obg-like ATPase 1 n=1 Tax=Phallusia mammillata TaxID=59560 RepID=A0A6F9DNE7_9ASCI|nr:obg-like ATPase 1 [Phallusia mammillata]